MRLLCAGSEVLTEKKEERSSNTSTGRSCSPLCPAGGHICWFSGPQIINLSADDSNETWEWHLTHIHKFTHTSIYKCRHTLDHTYMQAGVCVYWHKHTHTLCCITNDSTLIAVCVYLLLAVMDGPLLPGSQSEWDRKSVSSSAELDMLFDIPFYTQHTHVRCCN